MFANEYFSVAFDSLLCLFLCFLVQLVNSGLQE